MRPGSVQDEENVMDTHTQPPPAEDHAALLDNLARLADASLPLWDVEDGATTRLINLSENATYLVEMTSGRRTVLRIHREDYHTRNAIACELAWMKALREEGGVETPPAIPGRDGNLIQRGQVPGLPRPRYMVMFEFVEGVEPDESQDLTKPFERLGAVSARLHLHAMGWKRPDNFERLIWDFDHTIGATPNWGDWREAPNMDREAQAILQRQEDVIRRRLAAYGKAPDRYNLIHADIRLANLLIDGDETRVIDFDDSGFGWFMYDVATALSFIEDNPQVPNLIDAWLRGYRTVRDLPKADVDEIPTFVMLRRMCLLAWIGSHSETDLAQEQAPHFTRVSCELAEDYLSRFA